MSWILLLFFTFLVFAQTDILVNPDSTGANRLYFSSIVFKYELKKVDKVYVSSVSQAKPPEEAPPFKARSYSILPSGSRINSPKFTLSSNDTAISLDVTFTESQVDKGFGCEQIDRDRDHYLTVCKLSLEYLAPNAGKVLNNGELYVQVNYSMGILIPKDVKMPTKLGVVPIFENGCNCELVTNIKSSSEIFKDENCLVPFREGDSVEYGSTICMKIHSNDELAKNLRFETTRVILEYTTSSGNTETADVTNLARRGCGNPCKLATSYVIVDIFFVGRIKFRLTVLFVESGEGGEGGEGGESREGRQQPHINDGLDPKNYLDPTTGIVLQGMEQDSAFLEVTDKSYAYKTFSVSALTLLIGLILL